MVDHQDTSDARISGLSLSLPKQLTLVLQTLEKHGHEAVVVGGCVRDLLLRRPVHDYDVATSARPSEVMGVFNRIVPTGLAHGTVTVWTDDIPIEVTTYRVDLEYSDGRRPDAVRFSTDLTEDLQRRDFTINAIAMDVRGQLFDPFDGCGDLRTSQIRAVGDPSQRFHEDGLRILRALRFRAQLQFQIESQTQQAMVDNAANLASVSSERVGQELMKMAVSAWPLILDDLALGPYLGQFPEPIRTLQTALQAVRENRVWQMDAAHALTRWSDYAQRPCPIATSARAINTRGLTALCLWLAAWPATEHQAETMMRQLAWPRSVSTHVRSAGRALTATVGQWSQAQWFEALFSGQRHALWTACVVGDFLDVGKSDALQRRYVQSWHNMPIHDLRQLAVSGSDLAAIGFHGPGIGQCLRELSSLVLSSQLENSANELLAHAKSKLGTDKLPE